METELWKNLSGSVVKMGGKRERGWGWGTLRGQLQQPPWRYQGTGLDHVRKRAPNPVPTLTTQDLVQTRKGYLPPVFLIPSAPYPYYHKDGNSVHLIGLSSRFKEATCATWNGTHYKHPTSGCIIVLLLLVEGMRRKLCPFDQNEHQQIRNKGFKERVRKIFLTFVSNPVLCCAYFTSYTSIS